MFVMTAHLQLISQAQALLEFLYPEKVAAQDKEIYQFRSHVLTQLNQAQRDPEANQAILTSFVKQLQAIADEQDKPNFNVDFNNHSHVSAKTLSHNTLQKGAKIKAQVNYNYYLSTHAEATSPAIPDRIQDLGSTPNLLPDFIGRTTTIKAIKIAIENSIKELEKTSITKLRDPSTRIENVSVFVISGTNGIGKTSLARELFEDLSPHYNLAAWIDASPERLYNNFCMLGEKLDVSLDGKSPERIVADIHTQLAKNAPVLLVFDGAENKDAIHKYLPQNIAFKSSKYCHCLVTSIKFDSANKNNFELDVFNSAEARGYIKKKLEKMTFKPSNQEEYDIEKQDEENDVNTLIEQLGTFPLALAQAMAYVEQKGCSIKQYLQALEKNKADTLSHLLPNEENYKKTVMTTWEITMRLVIQQNPLAEKVLEICAYLHPSKISKEFLRNVLEKHGILETYKRKSIIDPIQEALHLLYRYSLIKKLDSRENANSISVDKFSIHLLLQEVIKVKIVHKDNIWWNVLAFRHANQRRLLQSLDEAISEIFIEGLTKQDRLEMASHWEAMMGHINKLKSYYTWLYFTSLFDFLNIKKYGRLWFVPITAVCTLIFCSMLIAISNGFYPMSLVLSDLVLSFLFGSKIAIPLSEQSFTREFFREYIHNISLKIFIIIPPFILLSVGLLFLIREIALFYNSSLLGAFLIGITFTIYLAFYFAAMSDYKREHNLHNECRKAHNLAIVFFNDSQFDKAEKISKLGLELLKSCAEEHPELEVKFHIILKKIYLYKLIYELINFEAHIDGQDEIFNDYQKILKKMLNDLKKTVSNHFTDRIELKEHGSENSSDQNKPPLKNSCKSTSAWHNDNSSCKAGIQPDIPEKGTNLTFFTNRKPARTDAFERSMPDPQKNYPESETSNTNLQEVRLEMVKKHN